MGLPSVMDVRVRERRAMDARFKWVGVLVVCGLDMLEIISAADLEWRFTQQCMTVILFWVSVPAWYNLCFYFG